MKVRAGIVGYRGYSGAELVRILERHSRVEPVLLEHRADAAASGAGQGIRNWKGPARVPSTAEAVQSEGIGVVFLATPPEVSMELRRRCWLRARAWWT